MAVKNIWAERLRELAADAAMQEHAMMLRMSAHEIEVAQSAIVVAEQKTAFFRAQYYLAIKAMVLLSDPGFLASKRGDPVDTLRDWGATVLASLVYTEAEVLKEIPNAYLQVVDQLLQEMSSEQPPTAHNGVMEVEIGPFKGLVYGPPRLLELLRASMDKPPQLQ